jgi:hypothetical protein
MLPWTTLLPTAFKRSGAVQQPTVAADSPNMTRLGEQAMVEPNNVLQLTHRCDPDRYGSFAA